MKIILKIISFSGLLLTVTPAFLVFFEVIKKPAHFNLMVIGAFLWFTTATIWIKGTSLE